MDKKKSIEAARIGAVAAFIVAGTTTALVLYAVFTNAEGTWGTWNDPSIVFDIVIDLICGFGMLRFSRTASVVMFVDFIFGKISLFIESGILANLFVTFIFLFIFSKAIQGTYTYHRIQKDEDPNYKPAPKWTYYLGMPLVILTYALLGFSLIMPSADVVAGTDMSKKNVALLIEKGIILPNEEVIYFQSDGIFSILEGGSILTNQRVIAYIQDEPTEIEIYKLFFDEIKSIDTIEHGNFIRPSIYKINSFRKDAWIHLYLSTEDRGDVRFIDALRIKMRR